MINDIRRYRRALQIGLVVIVAAFIASLFVFGSSGFDGGRTPGEGVAVVNGGTYGSEPHLPFGGLRQSGNGWREAGTQALDVYSDLKTIYVNHNPDAV